MEGVSQVSSSTEQRHSEGYSICNPSSNSLPPLHFTPPTYKEGDFYYGVRVVTGSIADCHKCDGDIKLTLIGSKAMSSGNNILSWLNTFPKDSRRCFDFIIKCHGDLGEVLVVQLEKCASLIQQWYIDFIEVHDFKSSSKQIFPCYVWIANDDSISVTSATTLPQDVKGNPVLVSCRETELAKRNKTYPWMSCQLICLPSAFDDKFKLPTNEGFQFVKNVNFYSSGGIDAVDAAVGGITSEANTLSGYEKFAKLHPVPDVRVYELGRWTRDVEFGRQILNGVNPVVIRRCDTLPHNFPVTDDMVKGSLDRGMSLEEAMKAGYVYICNLEIFDGIPCKPDAYCAAPICLLYVNEADQLKPIAIQLGQKPGNDNPIFLPTDRWVDWIAAKVYYMSAHAQFHELSSHFLTCHAAMETYSMGLMRNIPAAHPVYKLLRPHVRYTMAINKKARESLISSNGVIAAAFAVGSEGENELFRRSGVKYSIHWSNIKRFAKERGVDDGSKLPNYHYRDDGFKIWDAIESYVTSIIDLFYVDDSMVSGDTELQSFADDLHHNGFPAYGGTPGHDFPPSITTKAQLIEICTLIMFTGSAQHAAVNFGQYTYYSFVPNAPCALHESPPTTKGKLTYNELMSCLPDKSETEITNTLVALLSSYSPDEIYLGTYPAEQFVEEKAKIAVHSLQLALEKIESEIEERNKHLDVPYIYMLPRKIPNSITI